MLVFAVSGHAQVTYNLVTGACSGAGCSAFSGVPLASRNGSTGDDNTFIDFNTAALSGLTLASQVVYNVMTGGQNNTAYVQ